MYPVGFVRRIYSSNSPRNLRIAFFEELNHQVLSTYVILIVVTAFLFGYAENSPRGRVKL